MDAPLINAADLPDEDDLTGRRPDAQAEKLVQLRDGGVDVIGVENSADALRSRRGAGQHDRDGAVAVELFDDFGERGVPEM